MARTDNLTNYLTDVATAIKTKTGDNTAISPSSFDTKINSIKTAGDGYGDGELLNYQPGLTLFSSPTTLKKCLAPLIVRKIGKTAIDFSDVGEEHYSFTSLSRAFYFLKYLEEADVSLWNVSTITNFGDMFEYTALKNIDLSAWNIPTSSDASQYTISNMFASCSNLKRADLSCFKGAWTVQKLVSGCTSLEYLDIRGLDLPNCDTVYTDATNNMLYNVPTTCEIIVADQTQKTYMNTTFPDYTNIKTVAEL